MYTYADNMKSNSVPSGITGINPIELVLLRVLASHVALSAEVIAEAPNTLPQ